MAQTLRPPASEQWPLKRYGRFVPAGTDRFGAASEAQSDSESSTSWKVFDSNDKSGSLVLTIVVSGHFFISQGSTLLEGFSLIDSKKWLKIVRRVDCLLFGSTIKDKSRMFRVQFGGDSKEQALENCCRCVEKLEQYITIQVPDELSQELQPGPSSLAATQSQAKDTEQSGTLHRGSILTSAKLPLAYEQATWNAEELGPFLKLCLMDQNFPAFVEDVEKELKKLTGLEN
ncbi:meiotic recombination protein REC114 isoform X4 [Sarcophilus harrisii]|uniref:meiotic recombination protein REC114 isoform X4 n=1 Tax=Sarcophilus harrisii TaxID=9305 RepID=UPI001301A3C7|nr:meiotic recombination protein REC114 isoform X4 [Sarcophilus harrisii]